MGVGRFGMNSGYKLILLASTDHLRQLFGASCEGTSALNRNLHRKNKYRTNLLESSGCFDEVAILERMSTSTTASKIDEDVKSKLEPKTAAN